MHKLVALAVAASLLPAGHQAIAGPRGHSAQAAASHVAAGGFAAKAEVRAAAEKARSEIALGANAQREMEFVKGSIASGKK